MSTVIFHQQALQDSSSHVVESTTMRLKLVPPNCSFFESLIPSFEKKPSYVHPNSLLKMSPKSLELCTESLGSETGCDTSQSNMLLFPKSNSSYTRTEEKLVRKDLVPKMESKKVVSRGFPPPLTSISSLNLLHVRRQHEGGRLIIQAVEAPPMNCCFRAERSHGRLRLTYWKSQEDDNNLDELKNDKNTHGRLRLTYWKSQDDDNNLDELKNDKNTHVTRTDNNAGEDETIDDEQETEKQIFQWPSRCKEDGQGAKGMSRYWEPFWLATS